MRPLLLIINDFAGVTGIVLLRLFILLLLYKELFIIILLLLKLLFFRVNVRVSDANECDLYMNERLPQYSSIDLTYFARHDLIGTY